MITQTYPTHASARDAHKAAYNAALVEAADPYIVGIIFAEKGEECNASDLYFHDGDIASFVEGYRSVVPAPATRTIMAVGRIQGGERVVRGRALFDNSEVVEHTVNEYLPGKVVGEIRINERLLFRRIFYGDEAVVDATGWCDGTAPMADILDFQAAALMAEREQAMIDAIFGPVDADEPPLFVAVDDDDGSDDEDEGSIEDDHDDIRRGW